MTELWANQWFQLSMIVLGCLVVAIPLVIFIMRREQTAPVIKHTKLVSNTTCQNDPWTVRPGHFPAFAEQAISNVVVQPVYYPRPSVQEVLAVAEELPRLYEEHADEDNEPTVAEFRVRSRQPAKVTRIDEADTLLLGENCIGYEELVMMPATSDECAQIDAAIGRSQRPSQRLQLSYMITDDQRTIVDRVNIRR